MNNLIIFEGNDAQVVVKRIGAGLTAQVGMVGSVATMLQGFALLGEPLSLASFAGAGLILLGVWLAGREPEAIR